jgi:hypothetical protein
MIRKYLIPLFVLVVSACGPTIQVSGPESSSEAVSDNACHYKCNHCPPNDVCATYCVQSGNCADACVQTMLCIQGYHFDQHSCSCKPDGGNAGPACGNGHCAVGEVCCNDSCGICTAPGEFCIQIACL